MKIALDILPRWVYIIDKMDGQRNTQTFKKKGRKKMKTLNKVETKFAAIEDNSGGLHLAVFKGSQCVAFFSGFEYNDGSLVESINALDEGFGGCYDNADDPQACYNNITSYQYGWAIVADNDGIYAEKMGAAAQREFDIEAD